VGWQKSNKTNKYAIKTMKKAEIISSKHVDHIENEKNILEKVQHPFAVRRISTCKETLILARVLWLPPGRSLHLLRDRAPAGW
jgi:hypothetical protein